MQPDAIRMKRMLTELTERGIRAENVLDVMGKIPRELFVPKALAREAYDNAALPIGENQTISQPLVVAKMTEALNLKPTDKILEIGTGCGYQAAILCKLARRVYTIERFESLSINAEKRLAALGINNYVAMVGDGSKGWPQQAPFNAIIATAAPQTAPPALLEQLAVGGQLIIPIGTQGERQELRRYTKNAENDIPHELLGYVDFVPLVSD